MQCYFSALATDEHCSMDSKLWQMRQQVVTWKMFSPIDITSSTEFLKNAFSSLLHNKCHFYVD